MPSSLRYAVSEVNFLPALRLRGLALVAVGALFGAAVGLAFGRAFLTRHEARATLLVAALGLEGPVVPLTELRARAESRSLKVAILTKQGVPNPDREFDAYKVSVEPDLSREGTLVGLTVVGPDCARTLGLASGILDAMIRETHSAFAAEMKERQEHLDHTARASKTFAEAAIADRLGPELVGQTVAALESERWAEEVSRSRVPEQREVLTSRDTEVIDAPYLRDTSARSAVAVALGSLLGMLLGLALALIAPDHALRRRSARA
jgi:hypothetical protein